MRFGSVHDAAGAEQVKVEVEHCIAKGITLTVANAYGGSEDFAPASVVAVELVHEPTPTKGSTKR